MNPEMHNQLEECQNLYIQRTKKFVKHLVMNIVNLCQTENNRGMRKSWKVPYLFKYFINCNLKSFQ